MDHDQTMISSWHSEAKESIIDFIAYWFKESWISYYYKMKFENELAHYTIMLFKPKTCLQFNTKWFIDTYFTNLSQKTTLFYGYG